MKLILQPEVAYFTIQLSKTESTRYQWEPAKGFLFQSGYFELEKEPTLEEAKQLLMNYQWPCRTVEEK